MQGSVKAQCSDCGHEWSTRYQPREYRLNGGDHRLRCPECNQGRKGNFEFVTGSGEYIVDAGNSALAGAHLSTEKDKLHRALDRAFNSIVGTQIQNVEPIELGIFEDTNIERVISADEGMEELASRTYNLATNLEDINSFEELKTYRRAVENILEKVNQGKRLQTDIQKLENQRSDLKNEVSKLKRKREETKRRYHDIKRRCEEAEQSLETAQEQQAKIREKCEDLETAEYIIEECNTREIDPEEMLDLFQSIDDLEAKQSELKKQVNDLNNKKRQKETKLNDLQTEIDSVREELRGLKRDRSETRKELTEKQNDLRDVEQRLATAKSGLFVTAKANQLDTLSSQERVDRMFRLANCSLDDSDWTTFIKRYTNNLSSKQQVTVGLAISYQGLETRDMDETGDISKLVANIPDSFNELPSSTFTPITETQSSHRKGNNQNNENSSNSRSYTNNYYSEVLDSLENAIEKASSQRNMNEED